MSLLDRYIARKWFLYFFPSAIVLVAMTLAADIAFTLWEFLRKGLAPNTLALHYILKIPYIFNQSLPVAALLATLLTLTGMKRRGEMTAAFVSGTGIFRFCTPIMTAALVRTDLPISTATVKSFV